MNLLQKYISTFLKESDQRSNHSHIRGNMYGKHIKENPDVVLKVFRDWNISEKYMPIFEQSYKKAASDISQIFAVMSGDKPMYYNWRPGGLPRLLGRLGELIIQKSSEHEMKYYYEKDYCLFGHHTNVDLMIPEIQRFLQTDRMDDQFHYNMGIALGYPKADVLKWISNFNPKNKSIK